MNLSLYSLLLMGVTTNGQSFAPADFLSLSAPIQGSIRSLALVDLIDLFISSFSSLVSRLAFEVTRFAVLANLQRAPSFRKVHALVAFYLISKRT